jgi:amino acid permease
MERLLQYLDDLDDLFSTIGLLAERIRSVLWLLFSAVVVLIVVAGGILLALTEPLLALATAIILFVTLLYRSVTVPADRPRNI